MLEVVIRGTTVIHRSHVKGAVTAVGVMTYARTAGHISPAGTEAAKSGANPALSRNCDAPLGDESGRPFCAETNVSPRRKGGSGGPGRRASSSADAEVFVSGQTIDSRPGRSPHLGEAAGLGERPPAPFALSWSGGKDSALVLWTLRRQLFEPEALITTVTETYERISMHGVRRELLARQAEALGIPLVEVLIPSSCVNEIYEARMAEAFASEPLSGVEAVACERGEIVERDGFVFCDLTPCVKEAEDADLFASS